MYLYRRLLRSLHHPRQRITATQPLSFSFIHHLLPNAANSDSCITPSAAYQQPRRNFAFSSAEEAAAERPRRKHRPRRELPLHVLCPQNFDPPPSSGLARPDLPDSTSALFDPWLNLHNRVQSLIRASDLDAASLLARRSVFSNIKPTVFTCYAIIAAMYCAKRDDDAIALFEYFNLHIFKDYQWECPVEIIKCRNIVETNGHLDDVRRIILSFKLFLRLPVALAKIRREGSRKKAMMGSQNSNFESSALAVRGEQPQSDKGCPWCDHCRKHGHTQDNCWDIHGKHVDWKPARESGSRGFVVTTEEPPKAEVTFFSKELLDFDTLIRGRKKRFDFDTVRQELRQGLKLPKAKVNFFGKKRLDFDTPIQRLGQTLFSKEPLDLDLLRQWIRQWIRETQKPPKAEVNFFAEEELERKRQRIEHYKLRTGVNSF